MYWRKMSLIITFVMVSLVIMPYSEAKANNSFVKTKGTHFVLNGKAVYFNGFNAYWLMYNAADPSTRYRVTDTFREASKYGMKVARTWAFSDGGYRPLQSSPGSYHEDMFKGLDFVVSEANKHGIRLILNLVNNWANYGGKRQYVQWANERGQHLNNDDDFYTNYVTRGYYKNHMKTVLTRINSITRIAYKDDPTILAWELINEPRSPTELSGKAIQNWIVEMSTQIKSIDKNHLVAVGMEGFYGPGRKHFNPSYQVGTDFISNNQVAGIDFATIHLYPDAWVPGSTEEAQAEFANKWIESHIQDSKTILKKPLLLTEFGKSSKSRGYNVGSRDSYFGKIFNSIYSCAKSGGPCGGAVFWQVLDKGMENFNDGYGVVLEQNPSTAAVIKQQSTRISSIS